MRQPEPTPATAPGCYSLGHWKLTPTLHPGSATGGFEVRVAVAKLFFCPLLQPPLPPPVQLLALAPLHCALALLVRGHRLQDPLLPLPRLPLRQRCFCCRVARQR